MIVKGDRCIVRMFDDEAGEVIKVWEDDLGQKIFKLTMDNPSATLSGWCLAREFELELVEPCQPNYNYEE